jgi:hypothetical protein
MPITFPRDMPPVRIAELSSFDLQHVVALNQAGGSVQAMELGAPLWVANFTTAMLTSKQRAQVQAWWATLKGGVGTFYAHDCSREYPAYYGKAVVGMPRAGGGVFDGTATITANGITTVSLSALPANYHATDGDLIELPRAGGKISLHQIVEPVIGSAGGTITVTIEPAAFTDTVVSTPAVRLVKARCIMVPRPGSLSIPWGLGWRAASFEAVQTIK